MSLIHTEPIKRLDDIQKEVGNVKYSEWLKLAEEEVSRMDYLFVHNSGMKDLFRYSFIVGVYQQYRRKE